MWNKFLFWLWGEPPETFWALQVVVSHRYDPDACCHKAHYLWAAVSTVGWTVDYVRGSWPGECLGHVGPFPDLAGAEKFCELVQSRSRTEAAP